MWRVSTWSLCCVCNESTECDESSWRFHFFGKVAKRGDENEAFRRNRTSESLSGMVAFQKHESSAIRWFLEQIKNRVQQNEWQRENNEWMVSPSSRPFDSSWKSEVLMCLLRIIHWFQVYGLIPFCLFMTPLDMRKQDNANPSNHNNMDVDNEHEWTQTEEQDIPPLVLYRYI